LLDEHVTLTDFSPERMFYLTLEQGDKIRIQCDVTGEPIGFQLAKEPNTVILIDKSDTLSFVEQWTVPSDGEYVFYVDTMGDHASVHLKVTKE